MPSSSSSTHKKASKTPQVSQQQQDCYEGERLASLLKSIQRDIEIARTGNSLPEKFWIKQQFAVGVNEVTRVLERMSPVDGLLSSPQRPCNRKVPSVQLQAVLVAGDCNPRALTKDLYSLASRRGVPLIFVKDKKRGSLRLGELVKLKTVIAIGVKAKGSSINGTIEKIIRENGTNLGSEFLKSTEMTEA